MSQADSGGPGRVLWTAETGATLRERGSGTSAAAERRVDTGMLGRCGRLVLGNRVTHARETGDSERRGRF